MNEQEKTAVANAISSNDLESLSQLLDDKGPACCGWALDIAIKKGNDIEEFVNFLLNQGADVNVEFDQEADLTVFGYACRHLCADIVKVMLDHGADLYLKNKWDLAPFQSILKPRLAPIHQVFNSGDVDKMDLLSKIAIDTGKINHLHLLHHFVESNSSADIVRRILKLGANVNGIDQCGKAVLYYALETGNIQVIKILTENGANVNKAWSYGGAAMKLAVQQGNKELVEILLNCGANINGPIYYRRGDPIRPIQDAVCYGKEEICKLLLERGAKRDDSLMSMAYNHPQVVKLLLNNGCDGYHLYVSKWMLCLFIEKGKAESVKLLLDYGAKVNYINYEGDKYPLHCAIERVDSEIVKLLLDRGANANVEYQGQTPLKLLANISKNSHTTISSAEWERREEIVKLLLDNGARQDTDILQLAIQRDRPELVENLLKRGFDANSFVGKITALTLAVKEGRREIVMLLFNYGAQVNKKHYKYGKSPLHCAIDSGDEVIVRLLIDRGAKQDNDILHLAIQRRSQSMVKLLLDRGFDVNCMLEGKTTLNLAITNGKKDIVKLLLDYGAQVDGRSKDGKSALYCAAENGDFETVRLLLDRGANNINAEFYGQTALQVIIESGQRCVSQSATGDWKDREEIVKLLLDRGATTRSRRDDGVLHAAIKKNILIVVKLLLDRGFDANCIIAGRSALSSALFEGYNELVELLLEYGAKVDGLQLLRAVVENNSTIFSLLLHGGADVNANYRQTPLTVAIMLKRENFINILTKHIILKQSLDFKVNEVDLYAINSIESLAKLQDECALEIGLLKSQKFDDSSFSYIDILKIKDNCALAALANNSKIVESSIDFVQKYPIYGKMIVDCINKAIPKKRDFELIKRFIAYLSTRDHDQLPQLPFIVAGKIFSYLNDRDIATFKKL